MELKTKSLHDNEEKQGINARDSLKLYAKMNGALTLCELLALNAKIKCQNETTTEIKDLRDIFFSKNIGEILKIIYNDFNGIKKSCEIEVEDDQGVKEKYNVTLFLDIQNKKIKDGRIVLFKEKGMPFRLYEIENVIRGRYVNKLIHKNIILIIINILENRGFKDSDVESFIKAYLNVIYDIKSDI
ncbi:hypothetical protein [Oceanirhabdus sp. W0125-5]|uniref:hypothetical protein n=1 Tax=Oceanirhabdus sp. W0125-5 TaxID=2999116 RepID=UPI0022F2C01E|nr:hypothetical protein [Oceanirhabdus sp. W0125-5]WBW96151.1 hypothetical protein OW730_21030 [Oceanirhabdus sp. W0125-5]